MGKEIKWVKHVIDGHVILVSHDKTGTRLWWSLLPENGFMTLPFFTVDEALAWFREALHQNLGQDW